MASKQKDTSKYNFDSFNLILFIRRKFKPLVIITAIGAIISIIVSLSIENKYKSTVILFPTTQGSISKSLLSDNPSAKGVLNFGEEEEAEQLLQVLNSDQIRDRIVQKYNLMQHYEIEEDTKFPMTALSREFNNNISFERTKFMSVKIEVLDKDPQIAADIANDIAALVDSVMNRMQRDRARMALSVVETEYKELRHQIETLEDSLNRLRDLGVYDYESQAEVYSDAYATAIATGSASAKDLETLESKLKILAKYGGAYVSIRDFLEHEKKQLSEVKAKYVEAKVDAEQNLPHKYIVNSAYKAEKKSFPVRWLIVTVSTFATGLLALLLLIAIEYLKKLDAKR